MNHRLQFSEVLLVLMLPVVVTHANVVQERFQKLERGQSIMGRIAAKQKAGSLEECALRCLSDNSTHGYQYQGPGLGQCIIIHSGCERFQSSDSTHMYMKVSGEQSDEIEQSDGTWAPPPGWTGPSAVLYQSFDSSVCFVLMEGTQAASNPVPLVTGKVNSAWSFNRTKYQWVDLGIHTEACMARPETCGAAGGAISVDCGQYGGIISSFGPSAGSLIYCHKKEIRFIVFLPTENFYVSHPKPTGWAHVVLNYIGPEDGQGIRIFLNGTEENSDTDKTGRSHPAGNGRIVVGRYHTDKDQDYASVQVDELIYFDAALKIDDVQLIYNSA